MQYSQDVRAEATRLFHYNFNDLSFDLFQKAMSVDNKTIDELIISPSDDVIEKTARDLETTRDWDRMTLYQKEDAQSDAMADHYPCWSTIFETKDSFLSDKIIENIDKLYDLGIGVIAATDHTFACLFIAGAGYDFYDVHWIPMFEMFKWLDVKEIDKKKITVDLKSLEKSKDQNISRHTKGLIKALEK